MGEKIQAIERYLQEQTGIEWIAISSIYLTYKMKHSLLGQLCVFAPHDWHRKDPHARFFVPSHKKDLHNPRAFLAALNHKKSDFIKMMPWVRVTIDDKFPSVRGIVGQEPSYLEYTLSFIGNLKFRKKESVNSIIIGARFQNIAYQAELECGNILSKMVVNINMLKHTISLESGIETKIGETAYKIEPDSSVEVMFFPESNNISGFYDGWEVRGKLGYSLKGRISNNKSQEPVSIAALPNIFPKPQSFHAILAKDSHLIHSLVVFVKESLGQQALSSTPLAPAFMIESEPALLIP